MAKVCFKEKMEGVCGTTHLVTALHSLVGQRNQLKPLFQLYHNKRLELTQEDGILPWNSRVVKPEVLLTLLLKDLHAEHLGMMLKIK